MDRPMSSEREREAEIVAPHLPEGYSAGPDAVISHPNDVEAAAAARPMSPQSSLQLQGGDIHRDIYKIHSKPKFHKRHATFAQPDPPRSSGDFPVPGSPVISVAEQQAPGGFRRQYIIQQQESKGRLQSITAPITDSFISFLELYGDFAGEDFRTSEDEDSLPGDEPDERRPLLGRRRSSRALRQGTAGVTKSFFTLLKAFVGTGIMFLPKAFKNGGILFSSMTLIVVALICLLCFHLLLVCRQQYGGGYGEIGEAVFGRKFRGLVLSSIFISQIGFVCACLIFTAENMASFLDSVTAGARPLSGTALVGIQLVVLIPLAFVRNISKLGFTALIADVCILIGIVYIWQYTLGSLSTRGIEPSVVLFNSNDFTLTLGSAIFTFEGIGLILPIHSSMAEPQKFNRLLYVVMFIITVIYTSVGAFCYLTFGTDTRVEVLTNFPQDSKLVNAVQCLYSLAILGSTPVQLFPATRIAESVIFGSRSGKRSLAVKWKKNAFRTFLSIVCALIAIVGATDLDKFVALVGSFACIPLVYIYPALLHLKAVARNPWMKALDVTLIVVGIAAMGYTTAVTLIMWSEE